MRLSLNSFTQPKKTWQRGGTVFEAELTVTLAALALFLSALEYLIPKPLPFLRLGIANLPLLMAPSLLSARRYALLVLLKVVGQGLISGTLFSWIMVFSAGGALATGCVMFGLYRVAGRRLSLVGISVAGAFASTVAQLLLARWWIFGLGAWYIAPPFLAVGLVSGSLLGVFANNFVSRSRWLSGWQDLLYRQNGCSLSVSHALSSTQTSGGESVIFARSTHRSYFVVARIVLALLLALAILFSRSVPVQLIATFFAAILLLSSGRRIHVVPLTVMTASIIAFNLAIPVGQVLFELGRFPITAGALETGIKKALAVEGMIFVSRWFLSAGLTLPGNFGRLGLSVLTQLDRLFETGRSVALALPRRYWLRDPAGSVDAVLLSCVPVPSPQ